ncbi:MAG: phosphodiesterase [Microcystis wesenbergii Mw_MB_S_20031200_S109D]|uniref:Phosphodiesterase n=1 Tax=Microcystis wesenbergii Mw_MB_S_20031200_S109D TaxID=2486241 RepID=A0A552LZ56_9CHRO|nr:MAG: phosphodiesterase [Microcystis wesenbergii Mw_MB_S_20031200_S109D]
MNKVLMIGLDGATFSLLNPLMEDGVMPFLRQFVRQGVWADLMSTPNPLTPPGWVSMITGMSPDAHGIHDFLYPEQIGEQIFLKVNDSRNVRCETIWSMANRYGKRVTALNFFGMAPPPPLDGYSISGFVTWKHLRSATHPSQLIDTIKNLPNFDYKHLGMDITEEKKTIQGIPEEEYEDWIAIHSQRTKTWADLLAYLMTNDPTDLTAIVLDSPDKLQHFFWRYLYPPLMGTDADPKESQIRELCIQHYRELDGMIEQLVQLAGPETNVLLTSDHGFGTTTEVVYLNEWLARQGYLTWGETAQTDTDGKLTADRMKDHLMLIDWQKTIAYCPTPSSNGIYIKKETPLNHGVKKEDYQQFCQSLQQQLLDYRNPDDGEPIFLEVTLNRAKLAGRPEAENSPDMTVRLRDGGFVSILKSTEVVRPRVKPDGTHRPAGIFIGSGPDFVSGQQLQPLSILDITPLLLYCLQLPIPTNLEGRVPQEVLKPEVLKSRPINYQDFSDSWEQESNEEEAEISETEKEALLHQLQLLGYME